MSLADSSILIFHPLLSGHGILVAYAKYIFAIWQPDDLIENMLN